MLILSNFDNSFGVPVCSIAIKLCNCCKRSVHLLLKELKDYDANIGYSKSRKTYYYSNDFDLQVSISVNVLTNNQVTKIFGGSYFLKNNLFVARKLH